MTGVLYTVASGDLRREANLTCWPAQARLDEDFAAAVADLGWSVRRGHPVEEHGFIDSQRAGIEVFKEIPPEAPLVVVEACGSTAITSCRACAPIAGRSCSSPTGAASSPGSWACSTSRRA